MSNLFKSIGKGILYVLLFPVIIVSVCLYGVFGFVVFIFQFVKSIIYYFRGRSLISDLDEDIAAKAILGKIDTDESKDEEKKEETLSLYPSDSFVYGSGYHSPVVDEKKDEDVKKEDEDDD